jgi:arsenate reductase
MSLNHEPSGRVLVICSANRCRSQMAEGWLRYFADGALEVRSAGLYPSEMHPLAIQVMQEVGIDISDQHSTSLEACRQQQFDTVVTVCDAANEVCPTFPAGTERIHQSFTDPDQAAGDKDQRLTVFRQVRDQIGQWAEQFVGQALAHSPAARDARNRQSAT